MNVRDYLISLNLYPGFDLGADSGANDGTTEGDVLTEVDIDSGCGLDCKIAIDSAALMCDSIAKAYGRPQDEHHHPLTHDLTHAVLNAAVECCVCFIRG